MIIRRVGEHRRERWANGQGATAVIARAPDDDQWVWRLSLADVTTNGPFSTLPGIDRFIAVASGAGMQLEVEGVTPVALDASTPAFAFDGAALTHCRLLDGPVVDINLMVRRGAAVGELVVVEPTGTRHIDPGASCVALVVLAGTVEVAGEQLRRFEAVLADEGSLPTVHAAADARLALAMVRPA